MGNTYGEDHPMTDPMQKIADMERREQLREQISELGLEDKKQRQAVLDIMSKNPDLAPPEALALAAARLPDAFKGDAAGAGFDPRIHGSLRPTPGNQPPAPKKSDFQQRAELVKNLMKAGRRKDADTLWRDMCGKAGADALGWTYKQIEIGQ